MLGHGDELSKSRKLIAYEVHQGIREGEHRKAEDDKKQEEQVRDYDSGSGFDFDFDFDSETEIEIDGDWNWMY